MDEIKGIGSASSGPVIWKAIQQRAKGRITRYEMATHFAFEKNDEVDVSYMGVAIKQ